MNTKFGPHGSDGPPYGVAVVTTPDGYDEYLEDGEWITAGRGDPPNLPVEVQVGHDPHDDAVSRVAASIGYVDGFVEVRNESSSQPLYVLLRNGHENRIPSAGAKLVLGPGDTPFDITLKGVLRPYSLTVRLQADDPPPLFVGRRGLQETIRPQHIMLNDAQRKRLAAISYDIVMAEPGRGRPSTYRDAAERMGISRSGMMKAVAVLRNDFQDLIPGVVGNDDAKDRLAQWAVESEVITRRVIEDLGPPPWLIR